MIHFSAYKRGGRYTMQRHQHFDRRAAVLLASTAVSLWSSSAFADRYYVGPASGSWNNSANWSAAPGGAGGAGLPGTTTGSTFIIDSSTRNVSLDVSASIGILNIGNTGLAVTHLNQGAGVNLSAAGESLGFGTFGHAVHAQGSGSNVYSSFLIIGDYPSSSAQYDLSGNASVIMNGINNGAFAVGNLGNGTFNQVSGSVAVGSASLARPLLVGAVGSSVGTYLLGGGTLNVSGAETIGNVGGANAAVGHFLQTGGANTAASLTVTGPSDYQLSGASSSLFVSGFEKMSGFGVGRFTQTGGSNTAGGLRLGPDSIYDLSGAGSSLTVTGDEYVGMNGAGDATFTQSGGTHVVAGGLFLANDAASSGHYFLSGGTHTIGAGGLWVGASDPSNSTFGGYGEYTVSGTGALVVSGDVNLGAIDTGTISTGSGALYINGGSVTVGGTLRLAGSIAAIQLTGGALTAGAIDVGVWKSDLLWTSGRLRLTRMPVDVGPASPLGFPYLILSPGTGLVADLQASIEPGATITLQGGSLSATNFSNFGTLVQTSGTFSISGVFANNGTVNLTGPQSWGPASIFAQAAGATTFSSPLNPSGFGPAVVITGGNVSINSAQQFSQLRLATANAKVAAAGTNTLKVQSLTIGAGGLLDLTNNSMIIDYTGPVGSLADDTRLMLKNGQLISSSATPTRTLGYGDNALLHKTTFAAQSVDASSMLIKFTYAGDANLDGQVDVTDLGALATNWQTSTVWTGGDFNYDGFVDVSDLGALATNWQLGVGSPLAPESLGDALASLGLPGTALPEPASLAFIIGCAGIIERRGRRKSHDRVQVLTPEGPKPGKLSAGVAR
jgi:hypothetical protein